MANKPNKTPHRLSAQEWARARDLIASGRGFTEVARMFGVVDAAVYNKAKREGWHVPKWANEKIPTPPPPPPPPPKAGEADETPNPMHFTDDIAYFKAVLRWLVESQSKMAAISPSLALEMMKCLPNAIKTLALVSEGAKSGLDNDALLSEIHLRIQQIKRPTARPHDLGEEPEKRSSPTE